jgi:hypothetical protein
MMAGASALVRQRLGRTTTEDARAYLKLLSRLAGCAVILKHGTNLLPQFR